MSKKRKRKPQLSHQQMQFRERLNMVIGAIVLMCIPISAIVLFVIALGDK